MTNFEIEQGDFSIVLQLQLFARAHLPHLFNDFLAAARIDFI